MQKGRPIQTFLTISTSIAIAAILGSGFILAQKQGAFARIEQWIAEQNLLPVGKIAPKPADDRSSVLPLVLLSSEARAVQLDEIALSDRPSIERSRARYLLAIDHLAQLEGGKALRLLNDLEDEYPLLAPYILLKRARAYELTNELDRSKTTLESLIETYPDSLAVAEAYYHLTEYDPQYGDRAIAEYPQHPLTHEIVRKGLEGKLDQPKLLLFLAKNTPDAPGMTDIRDYLVKNYRDRLTPEEWEAIADGYWEQWEYGKAGSAYAKAPNTSENLYRTARGRDLGNSKAEAKISYQQLVEEFPQAEETGLALLHLARLSDPQEALQYLDRTIQNYRDRAPDALLEKAKLLEKQRNGKAASEAKQLILNQYPQSEAAARYRWETAQNYAKKGEYIQAWKWAHPIAANNSNSNLAPKASFWVGKWATRLNRPEDAQAAYKYVLAKHPESYYAWRSAALLGWDVGSFTTVRDKQPEVVPPQFRPPPPAGSELFQELYQLGQDEDAWTLWQAEFGNRQDPSVAEQFTEGLLLQTTGDYLKGINLIWSLKEREKPEEREEWLALRQTPQYWQALFPFPYNDTIIKWSKEHKINPMLVVSLIRQESRFEPEIRSSAGATGLMQVMPETGKWIAEKIALKDYSLIDPEDNISLGTWFLNYTHEEYKNNSMLAIASYNAGPGNVSGWVKKFGFNDSDEFVEKIPFGETKNYVESVFSNYWNYLRIYNPEVSKLINN
ncbi:MULTISPECIES: transglycosylase SLT domain-containing protein [Spirulina sp. CCY15215]|uniref:transglycosylase SLT domain-containing protein n=1 Tax=Spirulina sp. CCY15215 TaxID=2767591 RepID=UPI00194E5CB6|nr:transglycosylase SLT domain-containing protein [Spirulina major]